MGKTYYTPEEMYQELQTCHGGIGNHAEVFNRFWDMGEDKTFGAWGRDHYQCGNNLFCTEYGHSNNIDGKEHVFYFYSDNSDTIEDDKVYNDADEAFEDSIDFDFINAVLKNTSEEN